MSNENETLTKADLMRVQKALVALVNPLAESLEALKELHTRVPASAVEPEETNEADNAPRQNSPRRAHDAHCSFCGRGKESTADLIAGRDAYICTDCVGLCNEIISESKTEAEATGAAEAMDAPPPPDDVAP